MRCLSARCIPRVSIPTSMKRKRRCCCICSQDRPSWSCLMASTTCFIAPVLNGSPARNVNSEPSHSDGEADGVCSVGVLILGHLRRLRRAKPSSHRVAWLLQVVVFQPLRLVQNCRRPALPSEPARSDGGGGNKT